MAKITPDDLTYSQVILSIEWMAGEVDKLLPRDRDAKKLALKDLATCNPQTELGDQIVWHIYKRENGLLGPAFITLVVLKLLEMNADLFYGPLPFPL